MTHERGKAMEKKQMIVPPKEEMEIKIKYTFGDFISELFGGNSYERKLNKEFKRIACLEKRYLELNRKNGYWDCAYCGALNVRGLFGIHTCEQMVTEYLRERGYHFTNSTESSDK